MAPQPSPLPEPTTSVEVLETEAATLAAILSNEDVTDSDNVLGVIDNPDILRSVTGATTQQSAVTDTENLKYEWIESEFNKSCESYFRSNQRDISGFVRRTLNKKDSISILKAFKCILRNLIEFSNRKEINRETFFTLVNTLTVLVRSKTFSDLPFDLPYRGDMLRLQQQLRSIAVAHQADGVFKLRLSPEKKAELMAIRFDMSSRVGDIRLHEIHMESGG